MLSGLLQAACVLGHGCRSRVSWLFGADLNSACPGRHRWCLARSLVERRHLRRGAVRGLRLAGDLVPVPLVEWSFPFLAGRRPSWSATGSEVGEGATSRGLRRATSPVELRERGYPGEHEPQERQRHETRPQGAVRMKPSRACERSKREGASGGTEAAMPTHRAGTLKGRRTPGEDLPLDWRLAADAREGARRCL